MQMMLFEHLRVAVLEAVGFPQRRGIPVSWLQRFFHRAHLVQIFQFCFWIFFSHSPNPFFPTPGTLFALSFPASTSLPSWSQPGTLVCSPQGLCQSSLKTLLVFPHSRFQSQFPPWGSFFQPHRIIADGRCPWRLYSPIFLPLFFFPSYL